MTGLGAGHPDTPTGPVTDPTAVLRSQRDTLRNLLTDVLAHVHVVNRMDESIAVLPGDLVARITEAIR